MIEQQNSKTSATLKNIVPAITAVNSFRPRSTGSRTVIEERNGQETRKSKAIFEPFTAKLQISKNSKSSQLRPLGICHRPKENIHLFLSEKKGKLYAKITSSYTDYKTEQVQERYNHRFVPAGTEVAPYHYSTEDSWDYEVRWVDKTFEVEETEGLSKVLPKEAASVICAAVIQAANKPGSDRVQKLAACLQDQFPKEMKAGKAYFKKAVKTELTKLQEKADLVGAQLRELNMPSIGRSRSKKK